MLIRLENIAKSFPELDLFFKVNLQVNDGDRIGLVGPNGSGKSQLLGIIADQVYPDEGSVRSRSGLTVGLMEQETVADANRTLYEETVSVFSNLIKIEKEIAQLEDDISSTTDADRINVLLEGYSSLKDRFECENGYTYRQQTSSVLQGLGFSAEEMEMPCGQLSGGQISRLGLARLLLKRPDLLLMDEPTNHLDLHAIQWLESYLETWDRAFIVVSHDRYFLNRVIRQVWDISNRRVNSWTGNYSRFQIEKRNRVDQQRREYENQRQFINQTEDYIRRNIYGQKTKQAQSRRKILEKLNRLEKPVEDTRNIRLNLSDVPRSSDTVLTVNHLAIGYNRPLACLPLEIPFVRGDRVGVLGGNGTGKTTFFRTILGQIPPLSGSFLWGRNVSVGYFDQKMETLTCSPIEEMRSLDPLAAEGDLRSFLALFGFQGDDVFKPLTSLSGGEKNRLLLAYLIYRRYNTLVLDEPTNHLDIASREELESALETYPGTVFVVSHDRYFLDRLVNKILYFHQGDVHYFYGNYSDWERHLYQDDFTHSRKVTLSARGPKKKSEKTQQPGEMKKIVGLSKNERRRLEIRLSELESEIGGIEARQREIEAVLQNPPTGIQSLDLADLAAEHETVQRKLDELVTRWESVSEKLS